MSGKTEQSNAKKARNEDKRSEHDQDRRKNPGPHNALMSYSGGETNGANHAVWGPPT